MFLSPLQTLADTNRLGEVFEINQATLAWVTNNEELSAEMKEAVLRIMNALKAFDEENFDYVLLPANSKFYPNIDPKSVYIRFGPDETEFEELAQVDNTITANEDRNKSFIFFYLYSKKKTDPKKMIDYLLKESENYLKKRV